MYLIYLMEIIYLKPQRELHKWWYE